jgi:hypothetical protein
VWVQPFLENTHKKQRLYEPLPYTVERCLGIKFISLLEEFQENPHLPVPRVGVKSIEMCRVGGGLNRGEITLFEHRIVGVRIQRRFVLSVEEHKCILYTWR